ncbi:HK97 family phage prohead protease [Marinobacter adhaerens]|uniref:HK97 family phage prohead protease n=1 Tax=Marinobacter adhaerens TaxID=1033846 RepID=A0A851HU74_9GAMM|nr:HK97 family phage prohead protease [Marinobacter adhaerens]NWN92290.1 HK97 family phage prohead protease [Marinobacter adhaerens]
MSQAEKRALLCEVRAEQDEEGQPARIVGHGAVFNKRSDMIMGMFREEIAPGAFDDVLQDDVRALFNHDPSFILGRTRSKTLELSVDGDGLRYDIIPPDTQTVRDMVLAPLARGDITGSSFAFHVAPDGDEWREDEDGTIIRTINRFSRLLDVSPVTYPAYPDAGAAKRSLEARCEEVRGLAQRAVNQRRARERFLELIHA